MMTDKRTNYYINKYKLGKIVEVYYFQFHARLINKNFYIHNFMRFLYKYEL